VKVATDGNEVFKVPIALFDKDTRIKDLSIKVVIRKLDPATALPQVVLSGFTGGGHCCTVTSVVTEAADGSRKVARLGQIDGDRGYDYLDIDHDGTTEFVDIADGFLYRYASYTDSFAPLRIQIFRFRGDKLEDVTKDPRYRDFLLNELKAMEADALQPGGQGGGRALRGRHRKRLVRDYPHGRLHHHPDAGLARGSHPERPEEQAGGRR
jgi:hypothetical protein